MAQAKQQTDIAPTTNERELATWLKTNASALAARAALASKLGMAFAGKRDIYKSAGYPVDPGYTDYYAAYRRHDIARTIVRAYPDESWRLPPEILDGDQPETGKEEKSPFVTEWNKIAQEIGAENDADAGKGLLHYLDRIDRVSGIGRFGVLLLGIENGLPLDQPLEQGRAQPGDLLYASVFDESNAEVASIVGDKTNPRFGQPEYYNLTMIAASDEGGNVSAKSPPTSKVKVHWTRCIHVAEGLEVDDIYGTPRLEACFNRLFDLTKIFAGAGEAAWKLLDAGQFVTTQPDSTLPSTPEAREQLKDEIDEFINGLTRYFLADGLQIQTMGGSVQDPSGLIKINVAMISAATGIPQRILLGSERGELASSQDETNWTKRVELRQQNYITPQLLRPVIRRLIWAGVLPRPESGNFTVLWPNLQESDRERDARTAKLIGEAVRTAGYRPSANGLAKFIEVVLPDLSEVEFEEAPAAIGAQGGFGQSSKEQGEANQGEDGEEVKGDSQEEEALAVAYP